MGRTLDVKARAMRFRHLWSKKLRSSVAGFMLVFSIGCASQPVGLSECELVVEVQGDIFPTAAEVKIELHSSVFSSALVETPESLGFMIVQETSIESAGNFLDDARGTGFREWDLSWGFHSGGWENVAVIDENGLPRVLPGRYRAVVRFIPEGDSRKGRVCVAVSEGFLVEDWVNHIVVRERW